MLKSINPATNKLIKEYSEYSNDKVQKIISDLSNEFLDWRLQTFKTRKNLLLEISNKLKSNIDEHSRMISIEMGKPITESKAEILKSIWVIDYYAKNAEKFLEKEFIDTEYSESYVQFEPLGVVLGIMPWNFPYWQVFRFISPALMAGNVCLLKHAPNVSGCAMLIENLFKDSAFKGVFKNIFVDVPLIPEIISNKNIKAVSFTGGEVGGSNVAMLAGKEIKKTVLELGGSDSFIVLDDANIDLASKAAVTARFLNSGQSCIAAKRFLVHEDVYDDFILKSKHLISNLVIGDPLKKETQIGPLSKIEFAEKIDHIVQNSISKGALCLIGGKRDGAYYYPTLLVDVDESMHVFNCETFGPVFCVMKIKDLNHAIEIANNSEYGLGGSVWSKDLNVAKNVANQIETGSVYINDFMKSDPRMPFGGVKKSGYGLELSKYGIREFINMKSIVVK